MFGRDIQNDLTSFVYWGKENCMTQASTLDNEIAVNSEQKDYLLSLCLDNTNQYNHPTESFDTVPLKNVSDPLSEPFGSKSFYGLMPNFPVNSMTDNFSLSTDVPIRLSSPIHLNLSTSLPNPTIEQLSKKSSYSQNGLNVSASPSSNTSYKSVSPSTHYPSLHETSNTFSPSSFTARALSLSPVSSTIDLGISKKKSPSKSIPSNSGIKRPLNSFMLYRRDKQSSIPTNNHQSISRIIGEMWKRETIEEKERYAEMALRERERHAKEYPDYKFLPRKKKDKNSNGKSPRRRKTYDPGLEQGESKILRMMLNQISHKKSQSDTEKLKLDKNNCHWSLEDETKPFLKKTCFGVTDSSDNRVNSSDNLQLMSGVYSDPNTIPLPVFPTKDSIKNIDVYGSLDTFLNTFDNFNDHEIRTFINPYDTPSINEPWLGTTNGSCNESPQSVPIYDDTKNVDTFSEINESQNISLLPNFDPTMLQDDIGGLQDSFTSLWGDTTELSSSHTLHHHDILNRFSFELIHPTIVNVVNNPQSGEGTRKH